MERNIAIRLSYTGTDYHGWQIQKNAETVQGTIQRTLSKILKEPIKLVGCGRTDAGVHAERYCANFKTCSTIPADRLPLALNALLPRSIAIVDATEAAADFNAILSCKKKEYTYRIYSKPIRNPFFENSAYFYPMKLNTDIMRAAAAAFVGTHDFAAVRSVGTNVKTTVRTVFYFDLDQNNGIINLKVCASGFLYNMARAMVGTVLYASAGKIDPEDIPRILESGNRSLAGPTVPAHGLYMTGSWYEGPVGAMMLV